MKAIYYPKLHRLTYWIKSSGGYSQAHQSDLSEKAARAYLYEHIQRTEVVQELEIFK